MNHHIDILGKMCNKYEINVVTMQCYKHLYFNGNKLLYLLCYLHIRYYCQGSGSLKLIFLDFPNKIYFFSSGSSCPSVSS